MVPIIKISLTKGCLRTQISDAETWLIADIVAYPQETQLAFMTKPYDLCNGHGQNHFNFQFSA